MIDNNGGVAGLAPKGHIWYSAEVVANNSYDKSNDAEIIWRGGYEENSSLEADNFPPSLYGKGRVNPSQNLVDASRGLTVILSATPTLSTMLLILMPTVTRVSLTIS